ncbi:Dopey, N-terminal-domain-containing protein [Flagelloscypha sp. PMI_526]|nr:Dopey, N-terminal-domain-containing protein [Flagelloscypha sp. PMI_526]
MNGPSGSASFRKGSSSVPTRERAQAYQHYVSDPKFKKYTSQVEKCLNSFDTNVSEWADFIAFLKQLLKTFQSYMQFKEIPRKLIVAKRLAQCLNPALPNGVHQRALDVYAHILAVLGSEGLKRDLPLWSSGLFPFFEYAGTSVKPTLLNLYDTHYLPLQSGLRPVMKSFILALLPGLEEETGEFFDKVLSLMDRLSGTVSQSFFFQNIWLIMLTTPASRGTSLNFLARRLPKFNPDEDVTSIVGRDIGLMIRAFAAALEDENLLVRRGALDLLLQSMKVDTAVVTRAQPDDRIILMRAAISVVLRRDLALNRRLYTWLLGTDEKSEAQVVYFRKHALELLCMTLKDEMFSPPGDYPDSRPFKIFISLLDKWEIGAALTDSLAYDALQAVKTLVQSERESADEIIMTASSLYDAIEPQLLWKVMLKLILSELNSGDENIPAISLAIFLLSNFTQDEENQTIHLPVIFSGLVDALHLLIDQNVAKATSKPVQMVVSLLHSIGPHISPAALRERPAVSESLAAARTQQRPYLFACSFYEVEPIIHTETPPGTFNVPLASSLESLVHCTAIEADGLISGSDAAVSLMDVYGQSLSLIETLITRVTSPLPLVWEPSEWMSTLLNVFDCSVSNFSLVDRTVSLVVAFHQTPHVHPSPTIDERIIMAKLINALLQYLRPQFTAYHLRATHLIWVLEESTSHRHVEAILAQSLSTELPYRFEAYEAFGVLWRLTDDTMLPGFKLKVPAMIVLDTLNQGNPALKRVGETWMRCSLKSYLRLLDPLLHDLLDPSIRWSQVTMPIHHRELHGFRYERPFDQRYINHLIETLLSITRFGGQGFAKTAQSTHARKTMHSGLLARLDANGFTDPDTSYMDVLVETLVRFLLSEPKSSQVTSMRPLNHTIQSSATELLQAIVARGEIDALAIGSVEAAVISKLYFSIHTGRLDIQNKLLHLLHSVMSIESAQASVQEKAEDGEEASETSGRPLNPLLTQTLVDGIASQSNRPVLQHWVDFVLMAVPQFQPSLQPVVMPLIECICRQLQLDLDELMLVGSQSSSHLVDFTSSVSDAEFIMLLNSLERLVLLSLAYTFESPSADEENSFSEKPSQDTSGILGNVFGVFGSETPIPASEDTLTARSPGYRALDEGVHILYSLWAKLGWKEPQIPSPRNESLALMHTRARTRCRRVLEHLFRVHSAEVIESIVECWHTHLADASFSEEPAFEIVDILVTSAQNAVHMLCEAISCRLTGATERSKRQAINPNLSEAILFSFLERYLEKLEGPLALQVWGRYIQMIKDVLGNTKEFKPANYPTLRCLCVLADKVTQTSAMEDKRIRKELADSFGKLLDSCVMQIGKSYDSGSWIRGRTKEPVNGRESPGRPDSRLGDEKGRTTPAQSIPGTSGGSADFVTQMNLFMSTSAIPKLRKFLVDADKVVSACTNIVYYIVNPAMKARSRPMDVDLSVVAIIREIARIAMALKTWRALVVEMLNDNRLFSCPAETAAVWRPIIKSLFDADKTAFSELLTKVTTAPSANIFSNREYEMLQRSINLRRMSFVILTGDKNHFLTSLPTIQEKLVDTLRNVNAANVQAEVFMCIRVLLCRLSPHNLTSFWPSVITELFRVFELAITSIPADASEDLQLILAAAKCLDLLLVLQTEEFQVHQWIFITDTVDAIYRPEDTYPEALLDQLAEIAGSLPMGKDAPGSSSIFSPGSGQPSFSQRPMRRPLLGHVRQVESLRDLVPFFSSVSMAAYESVYLSGGVIDWDAVERSIVDDMFEGRSG